MTTETLNKGTVVVTGASGKLAPFVIKYLQNIGYTVAPIGNESNLAVTDDAFSAVATALAKAPVESPVVGLIHLVGAYKNVKFWDAKLSDYQDMFTTNVLTFVNVLRAVLLSRDSAEPFSALNIGATMNVEDASGEGPYRAAKAALLEIGASLYAEGLVKNGSTITPIMALDTDEKRDFYGERIASDFDDDLTVARAS